MKKFKKTLSANASWVVLLALLIFFSILSPNFMTVKNMITVLKQVSVNGICAVGLAIIMIGGGIDLSTGSQAAVAGMICSTLLVNKGWPTIPAFAAAIVITACTVGLLNGLAVAYTGMPPLIATLGTQNIARGIAYLVTNGFIVYNLPDPAKIVGQGSLLGGYLPICVILFAVIMVIGHFILNKNQLWTDAVCRWLQQGGGTAFRHPGEADCHLFLCNRFSVHLPGRRGAYEPGKQRHPLLRHGYLY